MGILQIRIPKHFSLTQISKIVLILVSLVLNMPIVLIFMYFTIFGWPDTPFLTHAGPLWYWNGYIWLWFFFSNLFAIAIFPLITLLTGIITALRRRSLKQFIFYFCFSTIQLIWGILNFYLFMWMSD
jgi:hypothetical protein